MYSLHDKTKDACSQLMRYGGVFDDKLLDILESVVQVNDSLHQDADVLLVLCEVDAIISQALQLKHRLLLEFKESAR